jgi:hypothetical protein
MHRLRTLLATLLVLCAAAPAAAQIAILDSARTREFFRRHYPECSATSPFLGAEE